MTTRTPEDSVEIRLRTLETIVTVLARESTERERLLEGVDRLGEETAGLNAVLTRVDENSRRLSNLEAHAVTGDEVAATVAAETAFAADRLKRRIRSGIAGLLLVALLAGTGYVNNRQNLEETRRADLEACKIRNMRVATTLDLWRALAESERMIARTATPDLAPAFRQRSEGYATAIERLNRERADCTALFGSR